MMNMNKLASVFSLAAVLALGACGPTNNAGTRSSSSSAYPSSNNSSSAYSSSGVVQSIDVVKQDTADSKIGVGTIAGALVGGIVGNQVGRGNGNTAATVIGAAGGAYAGHQIEKQNQQQIDVYKITIRMNDGAYQTVMQNTSGDLRVGDRVQIDGGVARRY